MNIRKGTYYYRFINDEIEKIRIYRIQNSETVSVIDMSGNRVKMPIEKLNGYTMLNPDGYITFTKVKMNGSSMDDVIVTFHRKVDLAQNNQPYAVCRQAITDVYTNLIKLNGEITYIGCSVSVDSCPQDIDFSLCTACDEVISMEMISYYIGDSIDTILSFIKTNQYNQILRSMKKSCNSNIIGCCETLKDLLVTNNFEYDILRGVNVYPVSFKINIKADEQYEGIDHLTEECTMKLEDVLKHRLTTTIVIKYSKDINIRDIEMDHIIIKDSDSDIYIIGYVAGEKVNHSYNALEDKRDYILMNSLKYSNLNC